MQIARPFLLEIWRAPPLRRTAIYCIVLALVAAVAEITVALTLLPILASLGVDSGDELAGFIQRLPPAGWLIVFALAAIVRSIVNWLSVVLEDRGIHEFTVSLQSRLYRALTRAHWDAARRISPAKLTNALQTQAYLAGEGFSALVRFISVVLLVAAYVVSAAVVFPLALPAVAVMFVVMWRANAGRSRSVLAHSEDYYDAQEELHQRYEDWIAISRIASLGVDADRLSSRFERDARRAAGHAVRVSRTAATTRITYDAGVAAVVLVGVPIAWSLETPPALLAFGLLLLLRVLPRVANLHESYQAIIGAIVPVRAVGEIAARLENAPSATGPGSTPLKWDRLNAFDIGVSDTMRKSGRRWILEDIALELSHGEWLAIAGPTGAGKTTLADVLLTLVHPDTGDLRIDGKLVDDALASRWRNQAAYVPQDVVLFDASIRANLKLFDPDATDDQLEKALQQSSAMFVLERLPNGLDTRVGPSGNWLSGGERQRIGIARALLRKPGFLVLDEPTAALDNDTQGKLMDALSNLDHQMSVVFITHRPELLRLADRIINIEDGRITDRADESPHTDSTPDHR